MATYGWRKKVSVAEGLFRQGQRFDFYQAVRLLESLYPAKAPPGQSLDPDQEVVRFSSRVNLAFPANDLARAERPPAPGEPARMEVNFLGLAGEIGPLPRHITERVLDRRQKGDHALADFLDLFNHRLITFLYRSRKKVHPVLDNRSPEDGRLAASLFSLIGLGTPGLRDRTEVHDRALLLYTGLMTGLPRTQVGLERMLAHYMGAEVEIEPFQGAWLTLDADQNTSLGRQNHALGKSTFLGTRVWDQQASFTVRVGPLSLERYLDFCPTGEGFRVVGALTRLYVGEGTDFKIRPSLRPEEVRPARLGLAPKVFLGRSSRLGRGEKNSEQPDTDRWGGRVAPRLGGGEGARLGWTSWIFARPPGQDPAPEAMRETP